MQPIRFFMVGGFLGAGKTTAIARLARHFLNKGRKVGIVTNDQAYGLVDTHSLIAQGFRVGEVPGACFCCKFNDLLTTAEKLSEEQTPDVVIAEPVGSCTDLVATVIEPLQLLHGDQYEVAPLAVLLKPEHGQKILRDEQGVGFSPKAAYIFLKQIEEADVVVINKLDKLTVEERDELTRLVGQRFPEKQVLAMSGRDGDGFETFITAIDRPGQKHSRFMDVDYDTYAEGEAELGWLNCQVRVLSAGSDEQRFPLDDLLVELTSIIRDRLAERGAEAAHLKILGQVGEATAIVNLVGSDVPVEISLASEIQTSHAELIVNARVAMDPETLEGEVTTALQQLSNQRSVECHVDGMQRFRPGRPEPTHRMA